RRQAQSGRPGLRGFRTSRQRHGCSEKNPNRPGRGTNADATCENTEDHSDFERGIVMQEPEAIVVEVEKLRRTKLRWKITAICALAALIAVLPVEALRTRVLMNQIRLERDRALQAERQADVQREKFLS